MPKETPSREMSTAAIASFVYGTIQLTLMCLIIAVVMYVGLKLAGMSEMLGGIVPTPTKTLQTCMGADECARLYPSAPSAPPRETVQTVSEKVIDYKEVIFLFVSNLLSLLGILTGIAGLAETSNNKKEGAGLAQLGLAASFICLTITLVFLWNVNLPL